MATVMNAPLMAMNGASLLQRRPAAMNGAPLLQRRPAERSTAPSALRVRCMAEVSSYCCCFFVYLYVVVSVLVIDMDQIYLDFVNIYG